MKQLEFEKLVQRYISIDEYEAKLTRSQRFALGLVATKKMRVDKFFDGFIYPMKQRLCSLVYTTMAEVIRAATHDERIFRSWHRSKRGNQKVVNNKDDQKKAFYQKAHNQQFQKGKPEQKKQGGYADPTMRAM